MTRALAIALLAAAVACKASPYAEERRPTREPERASEPPPDRAFREGSAAERERTATAMARLDDADDPAFLDVARTLVREGDAVVPPLLETLRSGGTRSRSRAAYVLGIRRDRRTIDALAAAAATDPDPTVRCEAGASLVEMGDQRGFGPLVDGLEDPDARRRFRCIDVLAQATAGTTLGYEADGPPEERAAAVARWRSWMEMRRTDAPAPAAEEPPPVAPTAPRGPRERTGDGVPVPR